MNVLIQFRRGTASEWASANPTLAQGEIGLETDTNRIKIGNGGTLWNVLPYYALGANLSELNDVVITSAADGDFLRWNGSEWINDAVNLGVDSVGDYIETIIEGTGVTVFGATGESASATISIGQDVATNASVSFSAVTATDFFGSLTGSASSLETPRSIAVTGDLTGSAFFDGSENIEINATINENSVQLGVDTAGDYVGTITAGTGVTVFGGEPGEGNNASVAIGQDVSTSASVTFAAVTAEIDGNSATASQLQSARNIALTGDVAGSVSFDGTQNVEIVTTVQPASVDLEVDTTGDYVETIEAGTGVTVFSGTGHGSNPSVAIGQDVATNASVTFAALEVSGRTILNGDLFVSGTTTQINTTELSVSDNIITLNSGQQGTPTLDAGIAVERGDEPEVDLRWSETVNRWEFTDDGENYYPIPIEIQNLSNVNLSDSPANIAVNSFLLWDGEQWTDFVPDLKLNDLNDVDVEGLSTGQLLQWDGTKWVNITLTLGTHTEGDYIANIQAGTGVTIFNGSGEGASTSIEIGQDVATNASVTFAAVTSDLIGNADSASVLQTSRTIELVGDVAGSVSFDGSQNAQISTTIQPDSVALGSDTSGDYVERISGGTGVTVYGSGGEGASVSVEIGQDVATNASVSFANVTSNLLGNVTGNADTATTLATSRTISLSGDVTGSVSFNGSQNVDIVATVSNDAVTLGADTTGNYVETIVGGTGVTVFGVDTESASASVAIGQDVATTADVTFNSVTISSAPSSNSHAVTKAYVDNIAAGIDWHPAVKLATSTTLPDSPAYDNGASGVGATLTATSYARLSVDGANATTGDRVLVKNQTDQKHNGVYVVTAQGSGVGEIYWVLTRASDFDGTPFEEITTGEAVFVTSGAVNARQGFVLTTSGTGTNDSHIVGTDNLSFTQFTGTQAFTAGSGIIQDGNTINVGTANVDRIVVNANDIDLATVFQSNTSGSASTTFITGVTVDDYGRVTGQQTSAVNFNDTTLTGVPTAPTAALNTETTQVATTEFVVDQIATQAIEKQEINAKGDLITGSANDTPAILSLGTDGFFLTANSETNLGIEWASIPTINALNDIGDVTITDAADGEFLKYDNSTSQWVNDSIPEINFLSDVGDVVLDETVPSGHGIIYNGSQWTNSSLVYEMSDLSDTDIDPAESRSDGQVIRWSDNLQVFVNDTLTLSQTLGMYLGGVEPGTGVTIFGGETRGTNASIAIGQDVATNASVTFAGVTLANEPAENDDATTKLYVDTGLNLKSNIDSPTFTGVPEAPTASAATNTTQIATTAFVRGEITALVGSAPETLDTLAELAAALADDDDFATTVTNSLALKAPLADPTFTGTVVLPVDTDLREQYFDFTASATLSIATHRFKVIEANSASALTITIPTNANEAFPIGTTFSLIRVGTGEVTIAGDSGVTVNTALGLRLRAQWSAATLRKRGTDTWLLTGDTKV